MIPVKSDLTKDGLDLLLYQFADKENINGLLKTYLDEVNQLDQDTFDLVQSFSINNATGMLLDYVGYLVQEFRDLNESDEDFRKRIKLKVLLNNSQGTPNSLLEILSESTDSQNVNIWEHFPSSYIMYTEGTGFSVDLCNTLRKAGPICSEQVILMVDPTGKSFVGAEKTIDKGNLVDDSLNSVVDINEDNITITTFSYKDKNRRSRLSEFIAEAFGLIDDGGNQVVTDSGDRIIVFLGGQKNQTVNGKLTEIIRSNK